MAILYLLLSQGTVVLDARIESSSNRGRSTPSSGHAIISTDHFENTDVALSKTVLEKVSETQVDIEPTTSRLRIRCSPV